MFPAPALNNARFFLSDVVLFVAFEPFSFIGDLLLGAGDAAATS